jgi:hypothetical protein
MASGNENGLMRIFWPLDFPRSSEPGVLVGWRNSEHDVFVVDVLNGVDVGLSVFLAAGAVVGVVAVGADRIEETEQTNRPRPRLNESLPQVPSLRHPPL